MSSLNHGDRGELGDDLDEVGLVAEPLDDVLVRAGGIRVLSPEVLVGRMRDRLSAAAAQYRDGR